jgi:hypothetical protein
MKFWTKEKKQIMFSLDSLFLFIFIFSILAVMRICARFIGSLFQNPPQRLILSNRELIFSAFVISYIITYLIQL